MPSAPPSLAARSEKGPGVGTAAAAAAATANLQKDNNQHTDVQQYHLGQIFQAH